MKNKFFIGLKFIFFVLLIPIIVATTNGFVQQLQSIPEIMVIFFDLGIVIYLFLHLAVYEPFGLYRYGQKLVSDIFRFFSPLVKVAPFFLPIFSILILIFFYFTHLIFKEGEYGRYFMFALGFTLTMHFVFTSRALREKESNIMKPNYYFAIGFIYIANIFIVSLLLDLILPSFSFVEFFTAVAQSTKEIYGAIVEQIFLS